MAQQWYCDLYRILDSREDGPAGVMDREGRETSERKGNQGLPGGSLFFLFIFET